MGTAVFPGRICFVVWKMAIVIDLPEAAAASSEEVKMWSRIVKWMLAIVNRRICSADQLRAVLRKMEAEAQYDDDGYITISEAIKLLVKCFNHERDW